MNTELRHRCSTGMPSLKRCSTTSVPAKSTDYEDESIDEPLQQQLGFFEFDSLNYTSTSWRNAKMQQSNCKYNDQEPRIISHFGSHVNFSSQYHYTEEELEPYRMLGDVEMDTLLDFLTEKGGAGAFDDVIRLCEWAYHEFKSRPHEQSELDGQPTKKEMSPPAKFYNHYYSIPPWVDWEQIQRGIDIFLAYLPAAGCALYYRSLIGGFSIPKIVDVLIATRYLVPASMHCNAKRGVSGSSDECREQNDRTVNQECSNDDKKRTFERLVDTGGFMACCFAPPQSNDGNISPAAALRPDAVGWKAALRVRVLHAKVRRSLLHSKSWDVTRNGLPINQEDMAATLLAFSVNVLMGIEYIAGRPLDEDDQRDYLALWRYLGWLLGVDTPEEDGSSNANNSKEKLPPIDPCGSSKSLEGLSAVKDPILHSYATLESMILHLLHPTNESCQLVHHLLSFNGREFFRSELCRKFLGDPLVDILGIASSPSIITKCAVYFVMFFMRCYTLLAMTFPPVRRMLIRWHGAFQVRFLMAWERNHDKRVGAAMKRTYEDSTVEKKSCPFSMLMPPVDNSAYEKVES